ncbi:MAG: Kef-type transport system NAD-binding component-related rane protein [Phenylobacterium sp.]|nr:Kef-type transport system NAD-binding component-related rane protein [Phenylobacterium sp.]
MLGLEGLAFAIVTSFLIVLIHYESLRLISTIADEAPLNPRLKMLVVIMGVLAAHMIEAGVFALAFWLGAEVFDIGRFVGHPPTNAYQYYGFALETYTTQSVGDLYPIGGLRVMASLEPLVGLILIGWSTSLTFFLMRRYWRVTPGRVRP